MGLFWSVPAGVSLEWAWDEPELRMGLYAVGGRGEQLQGTQALGCGVGGWGRRC